MATAIVSVMTGIPVRKEVAMTGEVTLRGRVLPIGGLKEKLLAALRGGIRLVLIPEENERELSEVPDNIKGNLEIKTVNLATREQFSGLPTAYEERRDRAARALEERERVRYRA